MYLLVLTFNKLKHMYSIVWVKRQALSGLAGTQGREPAGRAGGREQLRVAAGLSCVQTEPVGIESSWEWWVGEKKTSERGSGDEWQRPGGEMIKSMPRALRPACPKTTIYRKLLTLDPPRDWGTGSTGRELARLTIVWFGVAIVQMRHHPSMINRGRKLTTH